PTDKPSAPVPPPPSSTASSAAAQRSFVTGRNYCNICNKELCNKYFMKTHMLKMHGINLDEQPADAAKNSIIGGVTCEICQKELCSKYFLKVHKQNTHGIYEDPPPGKENSLSLVPSDYLFGGGQAVSPGDLSSVAQGLTGGSDPGSRNLSQYTEVCPLCDRRFKSIKWLKTHMINDHSDTLKENLHVQSIPGPRFQATSAETAGALLALLPHGAAHAGSPAPRMCVVCGQAFPDKVALQIHLIKEHRTSSEELGLMNLSGRPSPSRDTSTPSNDNSNGRLACPAEPAKPLGDRGPPASPAGGPKRHTAGVTLNATTIQQLPYRAAGVERRFVCRVCHRAYRFSHSLQRHSLSHREQPEDLSKSATPTSLPLSSSHDASDAIHRRYRCSRCAARFDVKELCMQHIQQGHSGLRRLGFGSAASAAGLRKKALAAKPYKCRVCGFGTRSWHVLKIHITKQHQTAGQQKAQQAEAGAGLLPDVDPLLPEVSLLEQGSAMATALSRTVPPVHTPPPGFTGASLNNNGQQLPMTYVIPQLEPTPFILQPFLIDHHRKDAHQEQQQASIVTAEDKDFKFVPSLVYLPVCRKVSQPMTVAFTLTPA
ncbi:hypothetical protein BIW11_04700, partial [Tropilaelaps mercedesae]